MVIAYWFVIIKKGEIVGNIVLMMKIIISSVLAFNMLMIYLHTCSWLWSFICCYFECQDEGEKWRGPKVQKEWQNLHKIRHPVDRHELAHQPTPSTEVDHHQPTSHQPTPHRPTSSTDLHQPVKMKCSLVTRSIVPGRSSIYRPINRALCRIWKYSR